MLGKPRIHLGALVVIGAASNVTAAEIGGVSVTPIEHATMVLHCAGTDVLVDPGDRGNYAMLAPAVILVTHTHRDHFMPAGLPLAASPMIVGPRAVREELGSGYQGPLTVLANGESTTVAGVAIAAVPAYNDQHPMGWGNGYVVGCGGRSVYISGDTGTVPPLGPVDVAFLSIRDPFALSVEEALAALPGLAGAIIVPYHHYGEDVAGFAAAAEAAGASVALQPWYPGDLASTLPVPSEALSNLEAHLNAER